MDFFEKLSNRCRTENTLLCIGLDPRIENKNSCIDEIVSANKRVIEETLEYTGCYKPNIAFYEKFGPEGLEALVQTLNLIPDEVPVIIDAKRNDIGATAKAYADALFGFFGADAVTLNPYMGRDSVDPFLEYKDRGMFMLCRTSNPSAEKIQELKVDFEGKKEELFLALARECIAWGKRIGLVVGGNDPVSLKKIREKFPDVWLLAPGIGAQGGKVNEAIASGVRSDGYGILPMVGRAVFQDPEPGRRAREYRDAINKARGQVDRGSFSGIDFLKQGILKGLIDNKCFKTGEFVLKSGKKSPFYVDMRRISSDPALLKKVAAAYAFLMKDLSFDRIAGIPLAAIPLATAVSLETGIPMIYPRLSVKKHGTENKIEGEYNRGEKILLLDDLITTGKSKLEAIEVLRREGLIVKDLVVLIERGSQGRIDMENAGVTLHSYAPVDDLFIRCRELGLITRSQEKEMSLYSKG